MTTMILIFQLVIFIITSLNLYFTVIDMINTKNMNKNAKSPIEFIEPSLTSYEMKKLERDTEFDKRIRELRYELEEEEEEDSNDYIIDQIAEEHGVKFIKIDKEYIPDVEITD